MQRSAHLYDVPLARISFKGALDTLRHWSPVIAAASDQPRKQCKLIDEMLAIIARDVVLERPGRSEPRAKSDALATINSSPSQDTKPATFHVAIAPTNVAIALPYLSAMRVSHKPDPYRF